jgi:hypothetical protein
MPHNPRCIVIDATYSPHARLRPVPVSAVTMTDSLWAPRLRINREVSLPTQYQLLEGTDRIDNVRAAPARAEWTRRFA